jgi:hypothetical protein
MSKIKIIDNFLIENEFKKIQDEIMGSYFPWYYNKDMTFNEDNNIYFTHNVYKAPDLISRYFDLFGSVLNKLNTKSLLRIKANMYIRENKKRKHLNHVDYNYQHKGCLLYINDNNGETYFGKEKVLPKANRVVLFDPSTMHSSSSCDDSPVRITINFNYF